MTNSSQKTELLAPAGSLDSFFAAMEAGADAVYCGLTEFSARTKAKNFSLAEVEKMTSYCHGRNRRLFVALNTLIKEDELPGLVDILSGLTSIGIDALIIQDMGVWRLARAVLARELTLAEISAIRSRTTMELEQFIHGALCFSISGQCYFSSFLNGMSGNRGRCVQPCRRRYTCRTETGYYLSTSDLCAIDLLPQLIDAGITSLKIEGRMKSAEYVARVVSAYRLVLDASPAERRAAVGQAKEILKLAFGRQSTKGFFHSAAPTDIAMSSQQGSIGQMLGQISGKEGKALIFTSAEPLHVGDRLRVLPKNDQDGSGFTVTELMIGKRPVMAAKAGALVRVLAPPSVAFQKGDSVFKLRGKQAFTTSEEACRKKLEQIRPEAEQVRLRLTCSSAAMTIQGQVDDLLLEQSYPIATIPADKQPLSVATLKKVFNRTANTPFILAELSAEKLAPVIIHPTRLKEIRRDYYERLAVLLSNAKLATAEKQRHSALAALLPEQPATNFPNPPEMMLGLAKWADITILSDPAINLVVLPLTPANVRDCEQSGRPTPDILERIVWDLPAMIFEHELAEYLDTVHRLAGQGFCRFRLNNLGHFSLVDGLTGVLHLSCGFRLPTLNSQAGVALRELGAGEITLSLEDDKDNIRRILSHKIEIPVRAIVYSAIPLILSRIPIHALPPDFQMHSDHNDRYRVNRQEGLTVVTAETDFSLLGRLNEIRAMGCNHLLADLSHHGLHSHNGKKIMAALAKNETLPGTSTFNFDRGLR